MDKQVFTFASGRCIGCKACQTACADRADLEAGILLRRVTTRREGPGGELRHISETCRHCAAPRCVKACPTGALFCGDDGAVGQNPEDCIGCRACMQVCPYNIPAYSRVTRRCHKCDACRELRDQGEAPLCVQACPTGCLQFRGRQGTEKKQDMDGERMGLK